MKSDLRNLVTAEEAYFADSVKYTATTACTTPPTAGAVNFCVTTGNNLGTVGLAAGNGGWGVTITNNNLTTPLGKSGVLGKRVGLGGGRIIKKTKREKAGGRGVEIHRRGRYPPPFLYSPIYQRAGGPRCAK